MNVKEKIAQFKTQFAEIFNIPVATAPVVAPVAPVVPNALAAKTYVLDNGTEISIMQVGDAAAVGDAVTVMGAPLATGTYTLQDGTVMTLDAAGVITEISLPAPVTTDLTTTPAPATPVIVAPVAASKVEMPTTAEGLQKIFEGFASGSDQERIANLEVIAKALFENVFGWQIKETEERLLREQAINIYKEGLKNAQLEFAAHLKRQADGVAQLFSIVEDISQEPTAEPATVPVHKKEKFDRANKRSSTLDRIAAVRREMKPVS